MKEKPYIVRPYRLSSEEHAAFVKELQKLDPRAHVRLAKAKAKAKRTGDVAVVFWGDDSEHWEICSSPTDLDRLTVKVQNELDGITLRGSSEPAAKVELTVDGAPAGTGTADETGAWAITPDVVIPPQPTIEVKATSETSADTAFLRAPPPGEMEVIAWHAGELAKYAGDAAELELQLAGITAKLATAKTAVAERMRLMAELLGR